MTFTSVLPGLPSVPDKNISRFILCFSGTCFCVSFGGVSPYVCSDCFQFGLG